MRYLVHQLLLEQANASPSNIALGYKDSEYSYAELAARVKGFAGGLLNLGLERQGRVAVYLPKVPEAVISCFGAAAAGAVFVPVNPVLKAEQVAYILRDCNVRVLVTQRSRYKALQAVLAECPDLRQVILIDDSDTEHAETHSVHPFDELESANCANLPAIIDVDMAAILYTSGSTGQPKGVVLSHRNMVCGAYSVAEYLENTAGDRILAVLPFSFDYGFSQLTTAFAVGASVYLLEYLLPQDIPKAVARYNITGLAAVPPLWVQLANLDWKGGGDGLRYFTNSGGAMPTSTLAQLRQLMPSASPYLMYGLTEAFRSSYLPPAEVDERPESMGKAIPNAELMVVNDSGELCAPHEPGELVHRGSLVAMGYWNDPERTAQRFKPLPEHLTGVPGDELAVWSGDTVKMDEAGYLYFVGRADDMIKTSGYRVSPAELEEVVYSSGLVGEVAAIAVPHKQLGQAIVLVITAQGFEAGEALLKHCKTKLPAYMVPQQIIVEDVLPKNPNGKIDRKKLALDLAGLFEGNGK